MSVPILDIEQLIPKLCGTELPTRSAPRPYFHPVLSLASTVLTEVAPADHPHHLGLSIAFSDLNGTNFWGGSTYTAERGPVMLPNHGSQVLSGWTASAGEGSGTVTWRSQHGIAVAQEIRTVRCFPHPTPETWSLSLSSVMVPAAGVQRLEVSSAAVKGRTGAGYGGIFWRFQEGDGEPLVLSEAGSGADAAHGSDSPWLSIGMVISGAPVTVVLAQEPCHIFPWFIRADGYLGAGPAVAWSDKAVADADRPLVQSLHAVIHDGPVTSPAQALQLLERHPGFKAARLPDRTP